MAFIKDPFTQLEGVLTVDELLGHRDNRIRILRELLCERPIERHHDCTTDAFIDGHVEKLAEASLGEFRKVLPEIDLQTVLDSTLPSFD